MASKASTVPGVQRSGRHNGDGADGASATASSHLRTC